MLSERQFDELAETITEHRLASVSVGVGEQEQDEVVDGLRLSVVRILDQVIDQEQDLKVFRGLEELAEVRLDFVVKASCREFGDCLTLQEVLKAFHKLILSELSTA